MNSNEDELITENEDRLTAQINNIPIYDAPSNPCGEEKLLLNTIYSLNVAGFGNENKRRRIFDQIEKQNPDICVLIDTRLQDDVATKKHPDLITLIPLI